jgi:hypothetical protein
MYERILGQLKGSTLGKHFDFVFGNSGVIEPSPTFLKMHLFKEQNNDLLKQFLSNIESADIIIADLTNNNPNVHVELGIAISMNKNILRMSSRNLVEIGSDVRGYEVKGYSNEKDLHGRISNYLKQFLSIKQLPLNKKAGPFYGLHYYHSRKVKHGEYVEPLSTMRDGAASVKFQFKNVESDEDWFGVYFRHGHVNPWIGGYLLYARKNGSLELVELPNVRMVEKRGYGDLAINKSHILQFAVDGNKLVACLDDKRKRCLETDKLRIQSPGFISVGCHKSEVEFSCMEIVCRDTINF